MKKAKEKNIRILEAFCILTAAAAGVFCILYLLDLTQNYWFLNLILGLGVLLHVSMSFLSVVKRAYFPAVAAALAAVFYAVCLVFFML